MFNLDQTPYVLDFSAETELSNRLKKVEERMAVLRSTGALSADTIKHYYGEKRFELAPEKRIPC